MCHFSNVDEAFDTFDLLGAEDIILEDPSLMYVLRKGSYDQFYDEHPHIFSITALQNIAKIYDYAIYSLKLLPDIHGGSHRIVLKKNARIHNPYVKSVLHMEDKEGINEFSTYEKFAEKVEKSKRDLLYRLLNDNQHRIAMGATSKSTTIYNYCGITNKQLPYVVDTTPEKWGKYMPGTDIPVKPRITSQPKEIFLGAWNFEKEIQEHYSNEKFFTHLWGK